MIIDHTPSRNETGHANPLDMVKGRSKAMFNAVARSPPEAVEDRIEVVAMDEAVPAAMVEIDGLGRVRK